MMAEQRRGGRQLQRAHIPVCKQEAEGALGMMGALETLPYGDTSPSHTVPPAGDQAFKCLRLGGGVSHSNHHIY